LVGLFGVVLFGELRDLPGAPAFVAKSPVFDLCGVSWCGVVRMWLRGGVVEVGEGMEEGNIMWSKRFGEFRV
jgi:hypothetical protein